MKQKHNYTTDKSINISSKISLLKDTPVKHINYLQKLHTNLSQRFKEDKLFLMLYTICMKPQSFVNSQEISKHQITNDAFKYIQSWEIKSINPSCSTFFIMMISVQENIRIAFSSLKPRFLYNITHIDFQQLQVLKLELFSIDNIQTISVVRSPKLKQLDLSLNTFYSLKALAKTNFKQLFKITLLHSKFKDDQITHTYRMNFMENKNNKHNYQQSVQINDYRVSNATYKFVKFKNLSKKVMDTVQYRFSFIF